MGHPFPRSQSRTCSSDHWYARPSHPQPFARAHCDTAAGSAQPSACAYANIDKWLPERRFFIIDAQQNNIRKRYHTNLVYPWQRSQDIYDVAGYLSTKVRWSSGSEVQLETISISSEIHEKNDCIIYLFVFYANSLSEQVEAKSCGVEGKWESKPRCWKYKSLWRYNSPKHHAGSQAEIVQLTY